MARKLTFEQVTDSRMDENPKELLEERVKQLEERLDIDGVTCTHTPIRFLDWKDGTYQYRCSFEVVKETRKLAWDDIYDIINSIHATYYKLV